MMKVKNYVCPTCGKIFKTLGGWSAHIEREHPETIPEGYTLARYFYFLQTGKTAGRCVECGKPTEWNESSMKYNRFCNDPHCKVTYRKKFEKRNIDKYGYVHKLDDPEVQRKMLAARKISGSYKFRNHEGEPKNYVGKDELAFLQMLDMLGWDPGDIMAPSPHTYEYMYKNPKDKEHEGKHFYIPDFYIASINCEVEVKDTSNNHHKIRDIDNVKDRCKRQTMEANSMVNYVFIDRKNFEPFYDLLFEIKATILNKEIVDVNTGKDMRIISNLAAKESYLNDYLFCEEWERDYQPVYETLTETVVAGSTTIESTIEQHEPTPASEANITNFYKIAIGKNKLSDPVFKHVRTGPNCYGEAFYDSKELVGFYMNEKKADGIWIQAFVISPKYRGKGLSHSMLKRAVSHGKATKLSVNKKNTVAFELYKKHGFEVYDQTNVMYFMRLDKSEVIPAEEGYFTGTSDIEFNVKQFGEDADHNILWVTGLSGSGKTTLAKKKSDATTLHVALDDFFGQNFNPDPNLPDMYPEFYPRVKQIIDKISEHNGEGPTKEVVALYDKLIERLKQIAKADFGKRKYIIEGVQIFDFIPHEVLKGQCILVKGTSGIKSQIRAAKRDKMSLNATVKRTAHMRKTSKTLDDFVAYHKGNS